MLRVEIEGLQEMMGKLQPELIEQPLTDFFKRVAITIQTRARANANVDMGQMRNAIGYQASVSEARIGFVNAGEGSPLWHKARAMEYGTGRMGDGDVSHQSAHMPPGQALDVWGRRHGFENGWAVARIIGRRGGLAPRRFLRRALEDSMGDMRELLDRLGRDIAQRWNR